ncbi:hypothetical protein [Methanospirillum hungatei]|uniref:hypothetical protein n=1 Tax=Methanospirillum hungatei TaxID=2203 RepID=UPI0026F307C3|nr:hypothetical protein [Methanospirillum hungatei]MCA1916222.1 hypothetical protein [Methanospirillum hungatei]
MDSGAPLDDANEIAYQIRESGISAVVIDTEQSNIAFGLAQKISDLMGAKYMKLEELQADKIADAVKWIRGEYPKTNLFFSYMVVIIHEGYPILSRPLFWYNSSIHYWILLLMSIIIKFSVQSRTTPISG